MRSYSKNIKPGFGDPSNVSSSLNGVDKTWTATSSGIATVAIVSSSAGNGRMYIADTDNNNVRVIGVVAPTSQGAAACFPVIRGHTYKTTNYENINSSQVYFFQLV